MGWSNGEVIGVIARTGLGKSWFLLHWGLLAWQAGYRVLFLSPELPKDELEARWDALLCGMSGIATDAMDYYRGFKPTELQVNMAAEVAERKDWISLFSVDGRPFTIAEVPRLIQKHEPQLVIIDGLMFIRGERNRQAWERMWQVSYDLKTIAAAHEVPIIVSHQANRSAHNEKRPPALHEVFAGDGFAQACDRLLTLHKSPSHEKRVVVTVQKFRRGEPDQGGLQMKFDPGKGKINEVFDPKPSRELRDDGPDVQSGKRNDRPVPVP